MSEENEELEPIVEQALEETEDHQEDTPEQVEEVVEKPKKKSTEEILKSRIGALTAKKSQAENLAKELQRQNDTYKKLLESGNPTQSNQKTYTEEEVRQLYEQQQQVSVQQQAEQEFNNQANQIFEAGKSAYTDWADSVSNLQDVGVMSTQFLEAAMAVDNPEAVIHYLGTELDEAEKLASLSPARMGAALAKLSNKLGTPEPKKVPISKVPEPIKGITGSVKSTDLHRLADSDDIDSFAKALKKKMGMI
jgi:hypothetical protein